MTRTSRSAIMLLASLFVVTLLAAPSVSAAAVTITQVKVVVGGQEYCDTTTPCTGSQVWNLGGGVTLSAGQTLILTQTAGIQGFSGFGGNFDTSDRFPTGTACTLADPCTVQIFINSGSGLTLVYNNSGPVGDPLNAFNGEPTPLPDPSFNEAAPWQTVCSMVPGTCTAYTLDIGYADNEHFNACPATGCFPQAVWPPAGATVFLGQGLPPVAGCDGVVHPFAADGGCYDAGALRITVPRAANEGCTPGFWKNHPESWVGLSPTQLVSSVFTGALPSLASETLLAALQGGGGPGVLGAEQILLRAAVAALLNAEALGSNYPLTTAQVIAEVNAALASGDRQTILAEATRLDQFNNLGCPLS